MARKWVSAAAIAALAVLSGASPAAAFSGTGRHSENAQASPEATAEIALKLLRDGGFQVTEKVTVPGGQQLVSTLPLRLPADDGQDLRYTVRDAKATGGGAVAQADDQLTLTFGAGESTVVYTLAGALADQGGGQQVRALVAGGFDQPVKEIKASFLAPARQMAPVTCSIGANQPCTLSEVDHTGVLRLQQNDLPPGARMELSVGLPPGTAPANADFVPASALAAAFSLTLPSVIGFAVVAVLLIAAALFVWRRRKQDELATSTGDTTIEVLLRENGRTWFASPDGVLPGQIGTVMDESVDPVDIAATVVDLAVRNYLWLAELPGPDWQISRRNPPDEHLRDFERVVYETLLPEGTDTVLLSRLSELDSAPIQDSMYRDVVASQWFSRRPDTSRGVLALPGILLFVLGLVATAVLSFTVGHALLGVAVALAGLGLAAARALLPSRTARGRAVAGQIRGLLRYLHRVRAEDIERPADREMVFSRSLPYAVVLGDTERWLGAFADLDPDADGQAGLSWYGGVEQDDDLRRFGPRLLAFLAALNHALTKEPSKTGS
ncbi:MULTISPECIES: DUF2207 domain-containing protein [unclassified Amycolatopsis]|uniref:DUF2207 domain-containing protein n=1 Tax=unclassified Amycolatopsis TaxID=2618356 RepID=UPI0003A6B02D|nr:MULTISPECIES: DUF2207 domain-containing protein [unclassified Amycolatopsis]